MSSLDRGPELDRISALLADRGALALLLIEAAPLARIERRYGARARQLALEGLLSIIRDVFHSGISQRDLVITEERSRDAVLAVLCRPRSDRDFYTRQLPRLAARLSQALSRHSRRAIYPYHREPVQLSVGQAVVLYNPTLEPVRQFLRAIASAREDAALESSVLGRRRSRRLLDLILGGNLQVRFEPIVNLRTAQALGYEALTRGPEDDELDTPQQLFRQAEESNLLFELDCLCRSLALKGARALPRNGRLFLNCLPTAIGDPNLHDEGLRKTLDAHGMHPSDLVLEISEGESIDNFGVFREMRDSCRELGIGIAIDDAGTGYASLEAIMEIAPDYVKTDMGLIRNIDADPHRQEVVRALNSVSRRIGAEVIAEGVETDAELQVLRELEIPYGQGFYFGESLPAQSDRTE
jgi:EAL domain-containing protein (putative c-di-GMP-specific phosphodiesterase class I)